MKASFPSPLHARLAAALLATSALALAGCHADRIVGGDYPQTYEQRHPIVLSEGPARLDLPVGAGRSGLTGRQKDDIRAFAADWRMNGRGPVGVLVPHDGASDAAASYSVAAVRATLTSAGVPSTAILTRRYVAEAPDHLAPIKLGYVKLKAEIPHRCGLWPDDAGHGGGDYFGETQNRDYWNFGCATQANLAAQVADPEDLARPRAETPIYAARRQTVVERYREGANTASASSQSEARSSNVGGQ